MRRLIAALAIVVIGLWAAGAPAWAVTETQELNNTVSGPFSGTTHFVRAACGCSFDSHQVFDLRSAPPPTTHTNHACSGRSTSTSASSTQSSEFVFRGTFVFTSSRGATLNGTATGSTDAVDTGTFTLTLEVTSGTSSFKGVTGHIDLSGTWTSGTRGGTGPASGTSTGALQRPK